MTQPSPTPRPAAPPPPGEPPPGPSAPARPVRTVAIVAAVVVLIGAVVGIGIAVSSGGSGSAQVFGSSVQSEAAGPTKATRTPVPIQQFKGRFSDIVSINDPGFAGILMFSCLKCDGNTVVETNGSERLLVNEIGPYVGTRWLNIRDGARTTEIDITADAEWEMTVGGAELAKVVTSSAIEGYGDDVLIVRGEGDRATITHEGKGNFAVEVLGKDGHDLAVNEIGSWEGTVRLASPSLVQVTADGDWSIKRR